MPDESVRTSANELKFRDPSQARALADRLSGLCEEIAREPISVMHVCGTHEQAIAKYGLRTILPKSLDLIMGPGCPVCVTDMPEVDEAVVLAEDGALIATYGDMLRVPGTAKSLADAQAEGARVEVVYSAAQAVELARSMQQEVVFFASGFETTAVATAAIALQDDLPPNLSILSAHKYVPPAMEIVAQIPATQVEGFLAAGHAATITGWGIFEPLAERYKIPVVVAGFEPLDILAGLVRLVELVKDGTPAVDNMYPRCVTREGNRVAQEQMWRVFRTVGGRWRGIADVPDGNLRLRPEYAHLDARVRFEIDIRRLWQLAPSALAEKCICGAIMSGLASPSDCELFGKECDPENPVGACMVSSEGTCKIWYQYGGRPDL
ncbi:MAG: hydrogenase formation protein HypD [Gemmatimonadota bacterium]|nr:MAG: hydrogenase formation protein HypD [Gemmatimonadota bacterium]